MNDILCDANNKGCKERHDGWMKNPPEWSAVRISDYGYTRMTVLNKSHLTLEQISDDQVLQSNNFDHSLSSLFSREERQSCGQNNCN